MTVDELLNTMTKEFRQSLWDVFIDNDLCRYTLETQLYLYLKSIGYDYIYFYSRESGVQLNTYDALRLFVGYSLAMKVKHQMLKGPFLTADLWEEEADTAGTPLVLNLSIQPKEWDAPTTIVSH